MTVVLDIIVPLLLGGEPTAPICCIFSAVPFIMALPFHCLTQGRSKKTVSQSYCLPYSSMYLPLSLISPFPPLLFDSLVSSLLSGYLGRPTFMSSCAGKKERCELGQRLRFRHSLPLVVIYHPANTPNQLKYTRIKFLQLYHLLRSTIRFHERRQ